MSIFFYLFVSEGTPLKVCVSPAFVVVSDSNNMARMYFKVYKCIKKHLCLSDIFLVIIIVIIFGDI